MGKNFLGKTLTSKYKEAEWCGTRQSQKIVQRSGLNRAVETTQRTLSIDLCLIVLLTRISSTVCTSKSRCFFPIWVWWVYPLFLFAFCTCSGCCFLSPWFSRRSPLRGQLLDHNYSSNRKTDSMPINSALNFKSFAKRISWRNDAANTSGCQKSRKNGNR